MAKTIAEKSIELATANAELISKVAGLDAQLAEATAQVEAMKAEQTASSAKITELSAANEKMAADLAALNTEKAALVAKVEELSATLALNPNVKQPEGRDPVAGGDAAGAADQPQNWNQALALCGNRYVEARTRFPKLFEDFLNAAKK